MAELQKEREFFKKQACSTVRMVTEFVVTLSVMFMN